MRCCCLIGFYGETHESWCPVITGTYETIPRLAAWPDVTQPGTSVPADSDDQQNDGSKPEALGYHVSNPPEEWKKVDFR